MSFYWIIFVFILVFSFIEIFTSIKQQYKLYMFYIVVLLLFFLSFLRWERGTDWDSYYNIFINEGFRSWDDHTEIGYLYLNKLVRKFTDNYTIFLFVQSFIFALH